MIQNRYLASEIQNYLKKKMVFLGGPRQVGKTTFAREIIARSFRSFAYFNWDNGKDRKGFLVRGRPCHAFGHVSFRVGLGERRRS